jgi:hypothetical protein
MVPCSFPALQQPTECKLRFGVHLTVDRWGPPSTRCIIGLVVIKKVIFVVLQKTLNHWQRRLPNRSRCLYKCTSAGIDVTSLDTHGILLPTQNLSCRISSLNCVTNFHYYFPARTALVFSSLVWIQKHQRLLLVWSTNSKNMDYLCWITWLV